jgi:hypothetical protein
VFAAKERHVLLIDEIDKADIELPNEPAARARRDAFTILEASEEVAALERPVVLLRAIDAILPRKSAR